MPYYFHISRFVLNKKFIIFIVFLICFFWLSDGLYGVNTEQSYPPADKEDVSSIDAMVKELYESITFPEGKEPDLNRLQSLFTPNAQFIRITPQGVDKMDVKSFVASFKGWITSGRMKSFYESEISRKAQVWGSIAQVFSTYKKGINIKDPELMVLGINSIQLYHDGQRWWMSSIVWEDERSDNPIPEKYLR